MSTAIINSVQAPSIWDWVKPAFEINRIFAFAGVVAIVFLSGADFRGSVGEEEFVVHWQIYLRLLIAFFAGVVGSVWFVSKTFRDFLAWPGLLVTAYVGWYGVSVFFSENFAYSAAAWCSLLGVAVFVPGAMRSLGGTGLLYAVGFATVVYLVGSWIAYRYFPEIGVHQEKITQTMVVERMGGLGHPNELGFYSVYTLMITATLVIHRKLPIWLGGLVISIAALSLITSFSRTSMLLAGFGLMFTLSRVWRQPRFLMPVCFAGGALLLLVIAAMASGKMDWMVGDTLLSITKSGSTDELTSATGRTEIWAYGIKKIIESPAFGYGYCSGRFVMAEYSFHCHNIVLNAALYAGVLGGLILFSILLYLGTSLLLNPRPEIDGLAAAILLGGLVEEMIGTASPAASTFIFLSLIFWRQLDMRLDKPSVSAADGLSPQAAG